MLPWSRPIYHTNGRLKREKAGNPIGPPKSNIAKFQHAAQISTDTYPYVRAPLATTFNKVYNIQHLNILRLGTNAEESGANALGDAIRSRLQCQCVYNFVESSSSLKLLDIMEQTYFWFFLRNWIPSS